MKIRNAKLEELGAVMEIYDCARNYMRSCGNYSQWINGYPGEALIKSDIENGNCYVCADDTGIHGVFAFILGEDPTYVIIKDVEWRNNNPYGTIHRIGSDGKAAGVFAECMKFCLDKISDIRIDTHEDNKAMQTLLERSGFQRCGIITISDGTPRIAYQYIG